jgi:hypothetical protein
MVGIGMNFAAAAAHDPNIEDTLLFASLEAMERDDLRVLAVLDAHPDWPHLSRGHVVGAR